MEIKVGFLIAYSTTKIKTIKTNNDSIIYLDLNGDNGKIVAQEIIDSLDEKKK